MTHRAAPRRRTAAFSLIELMVVIVIVAIGATGTTFAVGALTKAHLRSAGMRVLAASRYAYHRAIAKGTTVRVVLDTDLHQISIEEAHGRVVLARADARGDEGEGDGAIDPWVTARARLERSEGPSQGSSAFQPISDEDGDPIERYQPKALESGIRIVRLTTPHESRPRTTGKDALYFFPNGNTEHALVQLMDSRENVVTVEIAALTGRGTIHEGTFEPEELDDPEADPRDTR